MPEDHEPRIRALLRTEHDETSWMVWVEPAEDGTLVLTHPQLDLPGSSLCVRRMPPEPGTKATLIWKTTKGRSVIECVTLEASGSGSWVVAPAEEDGPDRRTRMRVAFSERLSVRVDGVDVDAVGIDLSESGLRCELLRPVWIEPGTELVLEFCLEDSYMLTRGRVLRAGEGPHGLFEMAVLFDELEEELGARIRLFAAGITREP